MLSQESVQQVREAFGRYFSDAAQRFFIEHVFNSKLRSRSLFVLLLVLTPLSMLPGDLQAEKQFGSWKYKRVSSPTPPLNGRALYRCVALWL